MKCPVCKCRTIVEKIHHSQGSELERKCILCGRRYPLGLEQPAAPASIAAPSPLGLLPLAPVPAAEQRPATRPTSTPRPPAKYTYYIGEAGPACDDFPRWRALSDEERTAIRNKVKAQIKAKRLRLVAIGERAGLPTNSVYEALKERSYAGRAREAIAAALGQPYLQVWSLPVDQPEPSEAEVTGPADLTDDTKSVLKILATRHHLQQASQILEGANA